jgi:hypothetical protein
MKKILIILIIVVLAVAVVYHLTSGSKTISQNKVEAIERLLKTIVIDTLEKDYRSHNINITVVVTSLKTDRITKEVDPQYISYTAYGKVSYIIQGKREWLDNEGNPIRLDPEKEITHWFSCEILEDRYGELYTDKYRIPLALYADKPSP